MLRVNALGLLLGLLCALSASSARAQNPPPTLPTMGSRFGAVWNPQPTNLLRRELWIPDGAPTNFSSSSQSLFISGGYGYLGQSTGASARLALSDASADVSWPRTDGPVYSIVNDGAGGWFLGGNFNFIENLARRCVAHVLPNGNVDAAFDAHLLGNRVQALLAANGVLYIAGGIGPVGGAARQALCAVDAQSGAILPWNPILGPSWGTSSHIYALAIYGDRVYVGGIFQETVQGVLRKHLMLIDRLSGLISAWDAGLDDGIFDMCLDGTSLVLAGNFDQILSSPRSKVAVLDAPTGALGAFSTTFNSTAWSVKLDAGTLFVGGYFSSAGGQPRGRAAAFDFNTSALLPWNPDVSVAVGGSLTVFDIDSAGGDVLLTGCFSKAGADSRENVAVVDRTTGAARPWHSNLRGGSPTQAFAAMLAGASAIIGGDFALVNCLPRAGVCALSLDNLAPTAWSPNIVGGVQESLQVQDTVYLAGTILSANGATRKLLAAVDSTTGTTTRPFDVSSAFPVQTAVVHAIAYGNGMLYAAGDFHTQAGVYSLIAVDPISGALIPGWNASIGGTVNDIALSPDGTRLYVGGLFSGAGSPNQARQNFAVINALTGAVLPTICNASGAVNCVLAADGGVYIGGAFQTVNGFTAPQLAQINPITGIAYDWTPMLPAGGGQVIINSLARYGRLIYLGGRFSRINGVWSPFLGAVDAEYAILSTWSPAPNNEIYAVTAARGRAFVGGAFNSLAGIAMPGMGAFLIQ